MTTEAEARQLRARIYGDVSDISWAALATVWTRAENLRWLRENQPVHCQPCPPGMHWKAWNELSYGSAVGVLQMKIHTLCAEAAGREDEL